MSSRKRLNKEEVSVDEAIKAGNVFVNCPSMFILLIIVIPGFVMSILKWIDNKQLGWFILIGFGLAIAFWAVAVTKWRIWAFTNVRNVHQLKTKARDRSIIPEEGSFFEKIEFKSQQDKKVLKELQHKFEMEDVFEKRTDFPEKIEIFASKSLAIFYLILFLSMFVFLCFAIYGSGIEWILIICFFISIYFIRTYSSKLISNKPQIILSRKGIETSEHQLRDWSKIKRLKIRKKMSNKSYKFYLEYWTSSEVVSICLEDLNVGIDELREALRIYRGKK